MVKRRNKNSEHYVDNKIFYQAMRDYRENLEEAVGYDSRTTNREFKEVYTSAIADGVITPKISDYLGECIFKIATRLSYSPNFINYSWRDEMISDGIENAIRYMHNFNPEKSKNPFAYFTTIIYYAFLRRIAAEKKQQYVKYKAMEQGMLMDELVDRQAGDTSGAHPYKATDKDSISTFIQDFEKAMEKKKAPPKKKGLEKLDDDEEV